MIMIIIKVRDKNSERVELIGCCVLLSAGLPGYLSFSLRCPLVAFPLQRGVGPLIPQAGRVDLRRCAKA